MAAPGTMAGAQPAPRSLSKIVGGGKRTPAGGYPRSITFKRPISKRAPGKRVR